MSVQRGDLVAGRYRLGDPLGPAWRARDEHDDAEVVLVPTQDDTPDAAPWRDRRAILPATATATGDAGAWLVAAPVPARTLADAVAQWGALPAEQVLTIAAGAVSALSGVGPHPAMTAEHILLTDEGKVLLLPVPTTEDALFDLGTALFAAAEGRSPFDPPTGDPKQPALAALIRGLMQKDPDHAAALDRAHAELSRLGAPLETAHAADTLMAAQSASAEAAQDTPAAPAAAGALTNAGDEPTHVTQSVDLPTQPMSAADLLAETGDSIGTADPHDAGDTNDTGDEPTQAVPSVTASDALPDHEATEAPSEPIPATDLAADAESTRPVPTIEPEPRSVDVPTQPMSATELLAETSDSTDTDTADTDDEPTQAVPAVGTPTQPMSATDQPDQTSDSDDEPTQTMSSGGVPTQLMSATDRPDQTSDAADEPTQTVPSVGMPTQPMSATDRPDQTSDSTDTDDEPTQAVPAVATGGGLPDHEVTRPVPVIEPGPPVIEAPTEPLAAEHLFSEHRFSDRLADTSESDTSDHQITQPVPAVGAGSPDVMATQALPLAAAMPPEPPPTKPEPIPAPQPQFHPHPPQSVAPPTQAATAFPPPPPSAPNPWLQAPPPPQPPPNPFQSPGSPGGTPGPGGPWGNQPPGPPFHPMPPGPGPKKNTGKTVWIIVGAVVAVALVVVAVVLATKSDGSSKQNFPVAAASRTLSGSASSSMPATSLPSGSSGSTTSSSSSPSPSESSSTSDSPSDTSSSSSDAYTPPPDLTSTPFDPSVLNEGATDKTPLTLEALTPQDFKDDRGVHYSLKAGSIQPCVQTDMSANMKDILTSNSCKNEIAASYVDDSGQYLVSLKVLPLPDQHTATVVYDDLAKESAADFGIWCPKDGPGSAACDGDYRSATIKQYREQQHRYVVLSVALAVNHSESSSIAPWLDAAAKKAVDVAGPDNWSGNQ